MSRISAFRSRKARHRVLFHEQLEDRSLLAIIITNSTNINLANSQIEVGGDTSDNPNVVNGSVEPRLAYSPSASAGDLGGLYGLSNLNDGDIGVGILSDGTYAIPFNGTLTLSFGGIQTISSIAIYNGYGNRDDGTYLLQDAANNTLGGYTISGTGGDTNNGVDSFWLTFTTPVTTNALKLTFAVPESNESTPSFREIQVFGPALTAGALDPTFGMGGKVTTDFARLESIPTDDFSAGSNVVVQDDGKIVVAGISFDNDNYDKGFDFAIARYNPNGSLDLSFGTGGRVIIDLGSFDDEATGLAIQGNKIVVAGYSYQSDSDYDFAVIRLNNDGTLDNSFDGDGKKLIDFGTVYDFASGIAVQGENIVVAGYSRGDDDYIFAVTRLNLDGTFDNSFDEDGKQTFDFGVGSFSINTGVALQGDKIVMVGCSYQETTAYDFAVARLNGDGSLDSSFDGDGKQVIQFGSLYDCASGVAVQGDKIVVAGWTNQNDTGYDFAVARLNYDGTLDNAFDGDGKQTINFNVSTNFGNDVALQGDKIVVVGVSIQNVTGSDFAVARLNEDGSLDTSFNGNGKQTIDFSSLDDSAEGMAVQPDGNIIVFGYAHQPTTGYDFGLVRLLGSTNDVAGNDIPSGVSMSGSILRFSGADGADVVMVSNGNLVVNGTAYSLAGVTEVRIWGRGGNDQIDLSGLSVRTFINGGNGNDVLTGGSSDDVIFGGAGDDTITGAAGNDFLIGGVGKDRLVGSAGNDILVAGDVDSTLDILALQAISQEWAASHSTNEAESIDSALDETLGDGNSDLLTGGAGADLFIINWDDKITDFQFGKPKTNKDGDVVIKDGLVAA